MVLQQRMIESVARKMARNRILHVSKYYHPFSGGTEQIARDCVMALRDDYEQRVIAFNDGREDRREKVDGIEVIKCGCFAKISSQSLSLSYKRELERSINEFDPDIVVFHYPNPFVASILLKAIEGRDIKLILYWHLDIVRQKFLRLFFMKQNQKLISRADRLIATSPNYIKGSRWLRSVGEKCVVVPNCINVERMRVTPEITERALAIKQDYVGKTLCIAVGRHTGYKGYTYLIQASKLLDDRFHIFITGTGELSDRLRREASGDPKVEFTGRIEDEEMKALILASDIFCFPSITKNEAFGLALAEAMYYEKPAVTFTIEGSGVNYVCLDKEDGLEVPNRDVGAYADALRQLAQDPGLRERYGKNGRKRVMENFLDHQFRENIRTVIAGLDR